MGDTGLEHSANTPEKTSVSNSGGAECGAVADQIDQIAPDLQLIIDAWPILPDLVKAGILAMVKAASGDRGEV